MSAMTTVLKEFADNGNSRTYALPNHSVAKPSLVIQKRKVASDVNGVSEDSIRIIQGTVDNTGAPLPTKDSVEIIVRRSPSGASADLSACVAYAREVMASTNFDGVVSSQGWLQ